MIENMRKKVRKYLVPHQDNDFRPHLLRTGGLLLILVFIFGALFASNIQRIILKTSDLIAAILPSVLIDLANADRGKADIAYLQTNPKLEEAARQKARDMATKGYFAHYSPEGVSPWHWVREADYSFVYAGENLAVNFSDSEMVNNAWMASPGHRANILNGKFTEVGVASERGVYQGKETIFVVQMFGAPAKAASPSPGVAVKPPPTDDSLAPLPGSNVLGEARGEVEETFVAVENKDAEPAAALPNVKESSYSSPVARVISSPTKMLSILYILLSIVLILTFVLVARVKHAKRWKHIVFIALILLLIFAILHFYRLEVEKGIMI